MRLKLILLFFVAMASTLVRANDELVPREIQDPSCIGIGKLPARSNFAVEPQSERLYLNGEWAFSWASEPQRRARGFYRDDYDRSQWPTIHVPSTMERSGYGVTQYVNSQFPFKATPPNVVLEPDSNFTSYIIRNPVGSYYREFTLPSEWDDQQIILHFAGVSSAAFVWVNGQKVGYTQGSRLPSEFDVTNFVHKGTNSVAVEVYKYCDGSYLEDQDYWRLSGIYRDVFVVAKPKQALWDVYAQPILNKKDKSAEVVLHYNTSNLEGRGRMQMAVSFYNYDGTVLLDRKIKNVNITERGVGKYRKTDVVSLPKVELWYEEAPTTYTLKLELLEDGQPIEKFTLPVAFRYIDIQNKNVITYNDLPLKIKGVNRHEFSPEQGWVVSKQQMVEDLELMKQGNVNFVRTSHYPNDPEWYMLCDKYGMMVMDEANVESHGLSYHKRVLPGDDEQWTAAVVDRMRRMVIRDRQHPSVVMWSLGNEAGFGDAFMAMREVTHDYDPEGRLIQYADMNLAADMDSRTYPTVLWLEQQVLGIAKQKGERGETVFPDQHGDYPTGKPFITNEFAHAMGNSLGNFAEYYEVFYREQMLGGGFIWDWIDQSLWLDPTKDTGALIYGGDNGDFPTNHNMLINGLVSSARKPNPHYFEMQKVFESVALSRKSQDTIEVINRFYKTNLKDLDFVYQIISDGQTVSEGRLEAVDLQPYDTTAIVLPRTLDYDCTKETFITLKFLSRQDYLWAEKGRVVAWEQFKLEDGNASFEVAERPSAGAITLKENGGKFICSSDNIILSISKLNGMIDGLYSEGFPMIFRPTRFNFYRVPTDNDRGWKMPVKMGAWRDAENEYTLDGVEVLSRDAGKIVIRSSFTFDKVLSKAAITYTVYSAGCVEVDFELDMDDKSPALSMMGLQFDVHPTLENIEWYGRGPHENYLDRKSSAAIGTYQSSVDKWVTPYVRPQENANRTDVRYATFSSKHDRSLKFTALDKAFELSAWPYSELMLENAAHDFELGRYNGNVVNINGAQQGVGGDNSWGLPVMPKYQLPVQDYRLHFVIDVK